MWFDAGRSVGGGASIVDAYARSAGNREYRLCGLCGLLLSELGRGMRLRVASLDPSSLSEVSAMYDLRARTCTQYVRVQPLSLAHEHLGSEISIYGPSKAALLPSNRPAVPGFPLSSYPHTA